MPLDTAVGILLSLGVASIYAIPLSVLLVGFGIVAALLPDIDIVTTLWGPWHHRTYTHYPLVYLPLFIVAYIFFPIPYALLLVAGVIAHLIHDTIGIGWGIAWLWPFSTRRFLLLPEKSRRSEMGLVSSWTPEEKPSYTHTGSPWSWIKEFYARPNTIAYVEYGALITALLSLYLYLQFV